VEDEPVPSAFPWSFTLKLLVAVVLAGVLVLVLHVGSPGCPDALL
jgi:hypothetical protein